MSDETVTFAFARFEKVLIADIGAVGLVTSRLNNADDINEYQVKYWLNGDRKTEWFYEIELAPVAL